MTEYGILDSLSGSIANNPLTSGLIAAGTGAVVGATAGAVVASAVSRKKRSSRKTSRKRNNSRRKRKQKKPRTAGKRKDRSTRRIRYTKNNQPYVILASGKARFISKRSAKSSKKRKGGRY